MHRHLPSVHPRTALKVAAAGATVAAVAHHREQILHFRPQLNSTVIEALSGAAGEVAQIALVYPLDTIKVRCQAAGAGTRQVVWELWRLTHGNWPAFLSALYAGAVPAAALSILVGSVHYCCFCATRRALAGLTAGSRSSATQQPAAHTGQEQQAVPQQHVIVSHGATGTHFLPLDDTLYAEQDQQQDPQQEQQEQEHETSSSSSTSAHDMRHKPGAEPGEEQPEHVAASVHAAEGSLLVNCCAAVITAALTALVESPLELFRHNSQAGQIQGNFIREMWRALRTSGPRALYFGFVPYCLESWPYDTSELLVVGAAKDLRQHPAVRHLAPAAYDLTVGGLAGTVAVLVSMPFDVIKTYIQTHGAIGIGAAAASGASSSAVGGITSSADLFWSTGKALVAKGGPQALFVGLAPRLAHQVPGAMVCWLVIESCHRMLTEHCLQRGPSRPLPVPST